MQYDHVFLSPDGCFHFALRLASKLRTYVGENPRDPDSLNDGATSASGRRRRGKAVRDAATISKVAHTTMWSGRGFQLKLLRALDVNHAAVDPAPQICDQ